jgi:hypothetical protein
MVSKVRHFQLGHPLSIWQVITHEAVFLLGLLKQQASKFLSENRFYYRFSLSVSK